MFTVKPTSEFTQWLSSLKDGTVRGAVVARVKRLAFGLAGKRTQAKDIQRAKAMAALLD